MDTQTQKPTTDDLLEAFLHSYNNDNGMIDDLISQVERLTQERDGYKRQANTQLDELDALQKENDLCREMVLKAEEIAKTKLSQEQELLRVKTQLAAAQKEVVSLKGGDSPKKMREQIARIKEKSAEKDKRIKSLERGNSDLKHQIKEQSGQLNKAVDKIAMLQKQLAHNTGSGLYHNGEHHLIIWPEITKVRNEKTGAIFESRSLLYLHQSGRGGLITYNSEAGEANLCSSPKGGLRPSKEVQEFAKDWLFKVNELQDGIVKEEDMIPINLNGNFDGN